MTDPEATLGPLAGDHDWREVERLDSRCGEAVTWVVCSRCGAEIANDDRTQAIPGPSCDKELVKSVMRS